MTALAATLTVLLPAAAAGLGLATGTRSRLWAERWAVVGAAGALVFALLELVRTLAGSSAPVIGFLGRAELGDVTIDLTLRSDQLSATVSVAVALVALCVQVYSTAYLAGEGTPEAPTRYPAYAATVSLFTAAMMLVVHAGDLVLLLIGWELMGMASYLLVGHHSERASARSAAVKAFLVTRAGDVGVLLAVVVLLAGARTTSIAGINAGAADGSIGSGTLLAAGLLLLAGVAGKSAQFPLHTWLPDAMEGPTPVSALIHAATMVAAGVFLVATLMPVYLAQPAALAVLAVLASVSMVGAALAAVAQEDLKRLLAYSTISQVAYMLGGVAVAGRHEEATAAAAPGLAHLLSHAGFKALLFLAAGCVIHLVGSTLLTDMGGLLVTHRRLAVLFGLGLAALAGIPPLGGFWSKEAVLTAAEHAAHDGSWVGWLVLLAGLLTSLLTGVYAGRAWVLVALGRPAGADLVTGTGATRRPGGEAHGDAESEEPHRTLEAGQDAEVHAGLAGPAVTGQHHLSVAMTAPLYVLAVPTVAFGLLFVHPPQVLAGVSIDLVTAVTGTLLALAGLAWALTAPRFGQQDVAGLLGARLRSLLLDGYRLDAVQQTLVVRPSVALARTVRVAERDVVDAYVRAVAPTLTVAGNLLRRTQTGLATGYAAWLVLGAVVLAVTGVVLV